MKYLKYFATVLLWILTILSFTANVFLLRLVLDIRQQAAEAIRLSAQAVSDLQAGSLHTVLRIQQDVPVDVPAASAATQTKIRLDADVPVDLKIADTPLNNSLLSTKDYLDRLYAQWQRDPLQALIAPLPQ